MLLPSPSPLPRQSRWGVTPTRLMIACTSPADVITLPPPPPPAESLGGNSHTLMVACTSPADVITLPLPSPGRVAGG